jgi:1-acyl-sn-glycerol-3-phosphate acyltransferase
MEPARDGSFVMDELKPQRYRDPRPAETFTGFHERARRGRPDWVYGVVRIILTLPTILLYRAWAIGSSNIPASGPVILAPNHFSNMDHFFAAVYLRRRVSFMAKSQLFGNPAGDFIFSHGGVFPVRRGHHDDEAFVTAHAILDRGGTVLIYAEGGRSRSKGLGQPRPGVGRLALESGVPVVPVAIHGSREVRGWKRLRFPKVTVQFGQPLAFEQVERPSRDQQEEAAQTIFDQVRKMYVGLEEKGRRGVIEGLKQGIEGLDPTPGPKVTVRS